MEEKKKWKVSHNNCPEIIVEAETEKEAIENGLKQLEAEGKATLPTPHPVRAWLASMGEK